MKPILIAVWLAVAITTVGAAYVVSASPQPIYGRDNTD
jgi:hypothetical protein